MIENRGANRNSMIVGASVHNQPSLFYKLFYFMEQHDLLNHIVHLQGDHVRQYTKEVDSTDYGIFFFISVILETSIKVPKTIIYCRSKDDVAKVPYQKLHAFHLQVECLQRCIAM